MALRSKVMFGSYEFNDVTDWNESFNSRVTETNVPRRHGSRIGDQQFLTSRQISMRGRLHDSSAADLRTQLDAMKAALQPVSTASLWLFDDRYITATKKSFSYTYPTGVGFQVVDWSCTFVCADPFYYSSSGTTVTYETTSGSGTQTATSSSGGNAAAPLILTLSPNAGSGPGSVLEVAQFVGGITVAMFTYTGTISSADTLIVDSTVSTVTLNGTKSLAAFSGDFFEVPANSATNYFKIMWTDVAVCSFILCHTARWY